MNSWTTSAGNQFSVKAEHTHLDKWFCYWRVHHGNENQWQWLCIPSKHMPETHKIDKVHTSKSILPAVETRKSKYTQKTTYLPQAMAATTLCTYVYYAEKQQQAYFLYHFLSCLKLIAASAPALQPIKEEIDQHAIVIFAIKKYKKKKNNHYNINTYDPHALMLQ